MGLELAKAFVRIRGDSSKLRSDLNQVRDDVTETLDGINKVAAGMLAAASAAGISFLRQGVQLAGTLEQNRIAFETMLGSISETDRTLRRLTEFAAKTPFTMPGIIQATRGLVTFGEAGDELMETLKILGDASAGTSTSFGMLALIFNQVRGVGKLLTQDFRQLSTRGVMSLQDIADHFDVSTAAAQKMLSTGQVGFEDLRDILKGLTSEGGRFFNMMQRQSQTLEGRISTLKDNVDILARTIGTSLAEEVKGLVNWLNNAVETTQRLTDTTGNMIPRALQLITIMATLEAALLGAGVAAKFFGVSLSAAIGGGIWAAAFVALAGAIGLVIGAMENLAEEPEKIEPKMKDLGKQVDAIAARTDDPKLLAREFRGVRREITKLQKEASEANQSLAGQEALEVIRKMRKHMENATMSVRELSQMTREDLGFENWEGEFGKTSQFIIEESASLQEALTKIRIHADKLSNWPELLEQNARRHFSGIGDKLVELQDQLDVASGKMTKLEKAAEKFAEAGATEEDIETFKKRTKALEEANKKLDEQRRKRADLEGFARRVSEEVQTPLEKLRDTAISLMQARGAGLITGKEFQTKAADVQAEQVSEAMKAVASELGPKFAEISDPVRRLQTRLEELRKLRAEGQINMAAWRETAQRFLQVTKAEKAISGLMAQREALQERRPLIEPGRFGFEQFGQSIQDALLQKEREAMDKRRNSLLMNIDKKIAEQTKAIKEAQGGAATLT